MSEALRHAREGLEEKLGAAEFLEAAYAIGVEAALGDGDEAAMEELHAYVAMLPPAQAKPVLRGTAARIAAERAHRRGDDDAAVSFEREAVTLLRSVGATPLVARALLDQARRHDDKDALAEARAIYAGLGATRWLARIDEMTGLAA